MRETSHPRGLVGTSVVIDLDRIDSTSLPGELALSAVTLAELAAGRMRPPTRRSAPAPGPAAVSNRRHGARFDLPLYTRNLDDFGQLDSLLEIVSVTPA